MHNTIRSVYLNILTELVKEEAPTMYLEDFLYYYNKAISDFMKLRYEKFEMTQQLTDDMRVWKVRYTTDKLVTKISELGKCDDGNCDGVHSRQLHYRFVLRLARSKNSLRLKEVGEEVSLTLLD